MKRYKKRKYIWVIGCCYKGKDTPITFMPTRRMDSWLRVTSSDSIKKFKSRRSAEERLPEVSLRYPDYNFKVVKVKKN